MNYIKSLLNTNSSEDEILKEFYLHPMTREEKREFSEAELSIAARRLFDLLEATTTEHILDIVESHKDEILPITSGSIPQFSEITDADRIPDIVISNPNCKYKLIGYFFNKDANDAANQKYGENHYKLAAQIGLCEDVDSHTSEGTTAVSFLGYEYKDLPLEERNALRPKLCLQVPIIQKFLIEARHGQVDAMAYLETILKKKTAVRRRSSIRQMLNAINSTLSTDAGIISNIKWGYKNGK